MYDFEEREREGGVRGKSPSGVFLLLFYYFSNY